MFDSRGAHQINAVVFALRRFYLSNAVKHCHAACLYVTVLNLNDLVMRRKILCSLPRGSALRKLVLSELTYSQPHIVHLRDGEVVVYRRNHSPVWQCRFKRQDGKWHRQSTGQYSLERAVTTACEMYDEARFRQRLGLAHETRTFAQIARATLAELRTELDLGRGTFV